jgi:hypothetical protein
MRHGGARGRRPKCLRPALPMLGLCRARKCQTLNPMTAALRGGIFVTARLPNTGP